MNRLYFKIRVPHEDMMQTLDVCIGENSTKKYSLDKSLMIAKTTQERIDRKAARGISYNKLFPLGLATSLTYEEAYALAQTSKFKAEGI